MAKTDTSERWFEARVVRGLTGVPQPEYSHALAPTDFAATHNGYVQGKPTDYNRDVALDVAQLLAFLQATQPKAVDTLELAADGIKAAVVSMPCWELFEAQDDAYRASVLGTAPRVGVEAAARLGWDRWLGEKGAFVGMQGFGASAPAPKLYENFGITAEAVADAARRVKA